MAKGKLAIVALIGTAAAFVGGILIAPKSGKETQKDIKDEIKKDVKKVKAEANKLKGEATKAADEVYDKAKVVAKDVSDKAKAVKGNFEKATNDSKKTLAAKPKTVTKKK